MPWRETPADLERARAERPVVVPAPAGALFGIFTPPAPEAPPSGLCAILLTRPRSHRNRMWVEGARRLAARGIAAFRFDYHGAGDSEGASAFLDPNAPYREDAVAVIRHLRSALGQQRFVVCGSCFDARTALSAFMDEGDSIAGLVFMAAPVMELDTLVQVHADQKGWGHLLRALRSPANWKALVEPARWRYMATVLSRVAGRTMPGVPGELPLSRSFKQHFGALVRSRARALFLYGLEDAEYASFRVAERTVFAALSPEVRRRFEIEVWPGTVHGFLEMTRQRETFARALGWMEALHPATAAMSRPVDAASGGAHAPQEASWTSA
jgi:pimeloyl-ACP methyl ester carboxylesterase